MYSFYHFKILWLVALFLWMTNGAYAQCTGTTVTPTVPIEIFVCDPGGTFPVQLDFAGLPAGTTSATIELSDVAGLSFVSSGALTNATLTNATDPTNIVFDLTGPSATVTFAAQVGCAAVGLTNPALMFDITLSCGDTYQSSSFGIRSPVLNITGQVDTPDPVPNGSSFTRTTTICNGGQGPLDNFTYGSASDPGLTPTAVTANGVTMTNNGTAASGEVDIDVTSAEIPGGILNFNDCIDIVETFDVLNCGFLNTNSTVEWGCNAEICATTNRAEVVEVEASSVDADFALAIVTDYSDCPQDGFTRNFSITNTSTAPGFEVCVQLLSLQDGLDFSTLAFTSGGTNIPLTTTPTPLPNPIDPDAIPQEFYIASSNAQTNCTTGAAMAVSNGIVCFSIIDPGEVIQGSFTQYSCPCDAFSCNSVFNNQLTDVQNLAWTNLCGSDFTKPGRVRVDNFQGNVDTSVPTTTNNGDQTHDYCYPVTLWQATLEAPNACNDCAFEFQYTIQAGLDLLIPAIGANTYMFTDPNGNTWPGTVSVTTDGSDNDVVSIMFDNNNYPAGFNAVGAEICLTVQEDCAELTAPGCGTIEVSVSEEIFFHQNQTNCPGCIVDVECADNKSVSFSSCAPASCICDLGLVLQADRSTFGCANDGCTPADFNTKKVLVGDLINVQSTITIDGSSTYNQLFLNLGANGALDITGLQGQGDITVTVNGGAACTIPTPTDLSPPIDLSACTGTLVMGDVVEAQFEIQVIEDIGGVESPFQLTAGMSLIDAGNGMDQAVECPNVVLDFILYGSIELLGAYVSNNPDIVGCGGTIVNSSWRHEIGPGSVNNEHFPCEIRTVHYPQNATVTVPDGYILAIARIDMLVFDPSVGTAVRVRHDIPVNIVGPDTYTVDFDTVFMNDALVGGINDCALDESYRLELRNTYIPTCNAPAGTVTPMLTDFNFGYLDVLESSNYDPQPFLNTTSPAPPYSDDISYTPIDVLLQSQVGIPYSFPDEPQNGDGTFPFTWELSLSNLSGVASANFPYLFFDDIPAGVTITNIERGGCGGTDVTPDTDIYNIPSLQPAETENICITGTYTGCNADLETIRVGYGYICDRAPTSVMDLTDNLMCTPEYLDLIFQRPTHDIQLADQTVVPAGGFQLCSIVDVSVRVSNGGTGNLFDTQLEFFLPDGVNYIPGSASICYNADGTGGLVLPAESFAIADPIDNGNGDFTYTNLNAPSGSFAGFADGFPGATAANLPEDLNEFFLKFQAETDCAIISGEQIDFNITANNRCTELADGDFSPGVRLDIAGIIQPNAFSLTATDITLDPCTPGTTQTVMVTTNAQNDDATGGATDELDFVKVCLDAGLDFVTETGAVEPDGRICATITIPENVANPAFSIEVEVTDGTLEVSDSPLAVELCALADQSAFCAVSGANCPILIPTEKANAAVTLAPTGCNCALTLGTPVLACDTNTDGVDNYTVSIPFDNGVEGPPGAGNYTIITTGTLGGDNPMTAASGTLTITYAESTAYSYQITGTATNPNESCDLMISGAGIQCLGCTSNNGTLSSGN